MSAGGKDAALKGPLGVVWYAPLVGVQRLYKAARRFLGKPWSQAMREMGHNGGSSRNYWTSEAVLKEIRCLRRHGPRAGVTMKSLQSAAWRHFGSWDRAKTKAGI